MRWVVVLSLVGCFSQPGLRDRDGGGDDAAGDGSERGDAGADATTCANGTWEWVGTIVDESPANERHPWLSADGTVIVFWRGMGGSGVLLQAERASVNAPFGTPFQIYPEGAGDAPPEADPSLTRDMLTMYATSGGQIRKAVRSAKDATFEPLQQDADLVAVNSVDSVSEGGFITDDERTFLFVAGDGTYPSQDLYIATRTGPVMAFANPIAFAHNNATANECCPTMVGDLLIYERLMPAGSGKQHIVSSTWDGTSFSPPVEVDLLGSSSFQQPTLSADGQRLVYVVNAGNEWHLEEAKLVCPP